MRRLEVVEPCGAAWERMSGDSLVRHCSQCDRQVHHLSRMTEAQAGALLLRSGPQGLCVRFQHDGADVLFEPARAQPTTLSPRPAANILAAMAITMAACGPAPARHQSGSTEPRNAAPSTPVTPEPSHDRAPAGAATESDAGAPAQESCAPDRAQQASPRVVVEASQGLVILEPVRFAHGGDSIDAKGREIVKEVAKMLRANREINKVAIIGHASADERDALKISERRAQRVLRALQALNIDPARLVAQARGSKEPIADNTTRQGRAKNRRIEFRILSETR
jgi:outer membrane protein OmpA-like peptidoglycan-associated protein